MGGYLIAFDPVTRMERWRVEGGGGSGGGVLATAGDLVFQSINDGRVRALDAGSGKVMWEVQTGQRGMGPPITYRVDGRQRVSVMGGQGGRGGGRPMVYTFVVDGKAPMPTPASQ
jgi:outer membrane protein assembly factor BamB